MTLTIRAFMLAAAFFVFAVAPQTAFAAKELKEIKMAYNPQTGNILGFIAMDKGFDEEQGLKITLVPFSNSSDALNALQAGKVDIAVSFGTAAPLTFVTKGADLTIFGGYVSGGMPVYARPDFDYKDMNSFVGQKIAVARMYTPDIVWRGAMMKAGLDPAKSTTILEFKKPADVLEAVKSGKADVGVGTNSTYLQALAAGLKIITWTNDLDPMHVCCRPVSRTPWIKDNPEMLKAFLKTWIRSEAFLADNADYCVKLNEKYLKLDEEQARVMLLETNQVFESDPKGNGVRYMWKLLGDLGYAETAGIDIEDHLNVTLYKQALDELVAQEPDNKHYAGFAKRYAEYNQ